MCAIRLMVYIGPDMGWKKFAVLFDSDMSTADSSISRMLPSPPTWDAEELDRVPALTKARLGLSGTSRNYYYINTCYDKDGYVYASYWESKHQPGTVAAASVGTNIAQWATDAADSTKTLSQRLAGAQNSVLLF